jgi:DNA-binding PadR family transcriptional regulator
VRPPLLTHSQFAVLSALLDGQARRGREIARSIEFHRVGSITILFRPLNWHGFIDRVRWRDAGGELLTGYRITESGRRAWLESADFYRHFVERFGKPQRPGSAPVTEVLPRLGSPRRAKTKIG